MGSFSPPPHISNDAKVASVVPMSGDIRESETVKTLQLSSTIRCALLCQLDFPRTPFASYAHPPSIVRDNANVHEIGRHIPVVDNLYPGISLSYGFDIVAIGTEKNTLFYTLRVRTF